MTLENNLEQQLQNQGFVSIRDFETTIQDYRCAFEKETLILTRDALHYYEKELSTLIKNQKLPLKQDKELNQAIANKDKAQIDNTHIHSYTKTPQPSNQNQQHQPSLTQALKRLSGIRETRKHLSENVKLIYTADDLLHMSYRAQGVATGSIFDSIIKDHADIIKNQAVFKDTALATLSIALMFFTDGLGGLLTSWLNVGLGIYTAKEAFEQYAFETAAHKAGFLSESPSLTWVFLALAGAGLDTSLAIKLCQESKAAIKSFDAVNKISELATLEGKVKQHSQKAYLGLRRAAERRVKIHQTIKKLIASRHSGLMLSTFLLSPSQFQKTVYISYLLMRQGLFQFEHFLREMITARLVEKIQALSPEDLKALKKAFEESQKLADELATHGQQLKLSEQQIERLIGEWAEQIDQVSAQQLKKQMNALAQKQLQQLKDKTWGDLMAQISTKEGLAIPAPGTKEFKEVKELIMANGFVLDVIKNANKNLRKNYRLRPRSTADRPPFFITDDGKIVLGESLTAYNKRLTKFHRYRKNYLEFINSKTQSAVRRQQIKREIEELGYQLHHMITANNGNTHHLVKDALERLKNYTIDRGANMIHLPSTEAIVGDYLHSGQHPLYDDFVASLLDDATGNLFQKHKIEFQGLKSEGVREALRKIPPDEVDDALRGVENQLRHLFETKNLPLEVVKEFEKDGITVYKLSQVRRPSALETETLFS